MVSLENLKFSGITEKWKGLRSEEGRKENMWASYNSGKEEANEEKILVW